MTREIIKTPGFEELAMYNRATANHYLWKFIVTKDIKVLYRAKSVIYGDVRNELATKEEAKVMWNYIITNGKG